MNFREISKLDLNYYEINREERNYAAILFTALCKTSNSLIFLNRCGFEINTLGPDYGIYFEYAFLRDLWFQLDNNEIKKDVIRNLLKIKEIDSILNKPIVEINTIFGTSGEPSIKYIESPSKWSITKYSDNFDNEDFIKVCRFKWSFNIKPDIVIHLDKNTALCIEAKYESGEGQYPGSKKDQMIFANRDIERAGQTELQKYMMEDLLGIKTKFMFLVSKKDSSSSHKVINWKEAFEILEISELPFFAQEMIKKISNTAV
jgi:hypothetical protein